MSLLYKHVLAMVLIIQVGIVSESSTHLEADDSQSDQSPIVLGGYKRQENS